MKKELWSKILHIIITVLTAIATTFGVTSCMGSVKQSGCVNTTDTPAFLLFQSCYSRFQHIARIDALAIQRILLRGDGLAQRKCRCGTGHGGRMRFQVRHACPLQGHIQHRLTLIAQRIRL